jgi:hypothetical protein
MTADLFILVLGKNLFPNTPAVARIAYPVGYYCQ